MKLQAPPSTWHSHGFRAMGSHITVWLDTAEPALAAEAFSQAEALFAANEAALSRFRPNSELSLLNAHSGEWVEVSDLLWQQIALAVQMAAMTNGRFDPTLLKALERAGYTGSFDTMTSIGGYGSWLEPALPSEPWVPDQQMWEQPISGQWTAIEFDEHRHAVKLPVDVHLDLGGISKGDTAQQVVELLRTLGPCLVDAGGDLVAGPAPAGLAGWPVAISAPWTNSQTRHDDLVTLSLAEGALATSGIDYRTWVQDGQPRHHLIDPRTGAPAQTDGVTVSILAGTAAEAEAWATATLVVGSTPGMATLLNHEIAGLMVTRRGDILVTPPMDQYLRALQPLSNSYSNTLDCYD